MSNGWRPGGGRRDVMERFIEKVVPQANGCWLWTGSVTAQGYGSFWFGRDGFRQVRANKAAYLLFRGPLPVGMQTDHLCKTPRCVNPDHLEAVTHAENMRRERRPLAPTSAPLGTRNLGRHNDRKTHCWRGHPFSPENTTRPSRGGRECRSCRALARWQLADYREAARNAA
jgi:hypothetical protein